MRGSVRKSTPEVKNGKVQKNYWVFDAELLYSRPDGYLCQFTEATIRPYQFLQTLLHEALIWDCDR